MLSKKITLLTLALTFFSLILGTNLASAIQHVPMYEFKHKPLPETDSTLSLTSIEQAVHHSAKKYGWVCTKPDEFGVMQCNIDIGYGVNATSLVAFSEEDISITYLDSMNLWYEPDSKKIHRRYNRWVKNLEYGIMHDLEVKNKKRGR